MWMITHASAPLPSSVIGKGVCPYGLSEVDRAQQMPLRWQVLDHTSTVIGEGIADRPTLGPLWWAAGFQGAAIQFFNPRTAQWEPLVSDHITSVV